MSGMKHSTIKIVLRKKLENWLNTINNEEVKEVARENCIVTGGAVTSMLLGEDVNDYDIYFKTKEATRIIAEYYVHEFNKTKGTLKTGAMRSCNPVVQEKTIVNCKGISEERIVLLMQSSGVASESQSEYKYFEHGSEADTDEFIESLGENPLYDGFQEDPLTTAEDLIEDIKPRSKQVVREDGRCVSMPSRYRPIFLTDNAITLSDKIQLVIRFYGMPKELHDNYDFVHAMCWYNLKEDFLELPQESLQAILSKTLIYKGSLYPLASVFRIRKFIERGWRITAGQLLKILFQVSQLDLKDVNVLKEQLLGVDQAYMHELISVLENTKEKIDTIYLSKVIDEIFE